MFLTNNGSVITNRGTMKEAIAPSRAITVLFSSTPLVIMNPGGMLTPAGHG